jgi:hypothetical protein
MFGSSKGPLDPTSHRVYRTFIASVSPPKTPLELSTNLLVGLKRSRPGLIFGWGEKSVSESSRRGWVNIKSYGNYHPG